MASSILCGRRLYVSTGLVSTLSCTPEVSAFDREQSPPRPVSYFRISVCSPSLDWISPMQKTPLYLFPYMKKKRKMSCKNVTAEMRLYLQVILL